MNRMKKSASGAVLVFVLGMLMILSLLVTAFLQNLHQDLQAHSYLEVNHPLRNTAYNVLEAVRCSVEQQLTLGKDFHKAAALAEKRLQLPPSVHVQIQLEDESGKIPLHGSDEKQLTNLFRLFADMWDARTLAKQYQQWLQKKPIPSTLIDLPNKPLAAESSPKSSNPSEDGQSAQKKGNPSQIFFPNALNDHLQLQEIEKFQTIFFDKKGKPNRQWKRLTQSTSLPFYGYRININSVSPDVLTVLSKTFSLDVEAITHYLGLQSHATEKHFYSHVDQIQQLGHGKFPSSSEKTEKEQPYSYKKLLTTKPHLLQTRIVAFEGKRSFTIQSLWAVMDHAKPKKKKRSEPSKQEAVLKLVELKENE